MVNKNIKNYADMEKSDDDVVLDLHWEHTHINPPPTKKNLLTAGGLLECATVREEPVVCDFRRVWCR